MINFSPSELELIRLHREAPVYTNEWFNLYPSLYALLAGFVIMVSIYMLGKFFWMIVYEWRFGLGDEYISGKLTSQEKIWLKEKYPLFRRFKEWLRK